MTWAPLVLSLEVAATAAVLAVALGTALALALRWRRLPARELADAIVTAPLVLPPTVLGYYLLVSLGPDSPIGRAWEHVFGGPIVFSFTGAVIAATAGSIPLVVRAVGVGIDGVDPALIAAARTLGASPARVVRTIVVPLAARGIAAGAILGFARALGDYGITMMVVGGHVGATPTASTYVVEAQNDGRGGDVVAMAIAMTLVAIALMYAANVMMRARRR